MSDQKTGFLAGGAVLAAIAVAGVAMAGVRRMLGRQASAPSAAGGDSDQGAEPGA